MSDYDFVLLVSSDSEDEQSDKQTFASYAILDFETSNLPEHNFNKVGLTELSVYGVAARDLENFKTENGSKVPTRPRVLHKLTLMINPMMLITPVVENITGLNNFMLEEESTFNENAANTLLGFLKHLKAPVCMVAHNGWRFDFPILKYVMERIKMELPSDLYCLDSIRAFHDIDQCRSHQKSNSTMHDDACDIKTVLKAEENFDARAQNEMTPKRPILNGGNGEIQRKRRLSGNADSDNKSENTNVGNRCPKSRRYLDFGESTEPASAIYSFTKTSSRKRWYPPKGVYTLPSIYKRVFEKEPLQTHYAEADVLSLMQLMQNYGSDFVDYANLHAIPFEEIPRLGTWNNL